MDRGLTRQALNIIGCTVSWLAAAFFAFWEAVYAPWFFVVLGDVITYGYDEAAGYNLRLAEDFWVARLSMLLIGIPFLLTLALAIHFTIKLRKRENNLNTLYLTSGDISLAADLLRQGRLVAVPTETVYGLAADATQEEAVQANYDAKGRPETKPLNVLVDGMDMVGTVCRNIPEDAYRLAEAFWPGPLTMILWGSGTLSSIVPAGGETQGVRCPDHQDTLAVIRALGRPLACPSANLSGQSSPKSAQDVLVQLGGRIDAVLDGGPCTVGVESTILDLTAAPYRILRQGGLSRERLEAVLGRGAVQ